MSKRFLTAVLAMTLMSLPGKASVYTLDFSGTTNTEIPGWGSLMDDLFVNGVSFHYDNGGSLLGDTAHMDETGVYGSTYGSLIMGFNTPIYGLMFDFMITNVLPGDVAPAVMAYFYEGNQDVGTQLGDVAVVNGTFVPYGEPLDTGTSNGEFQYTIGGLDLGPADTVVLWFNPVTTQPDPPVGDDPPSPYTPNQFNLSNITYGTAGEDLPEPGTWVMMISGLVLTGLGRYHKQQRAKA
jgi:hypothetical protein